MQKLIFEMETSDPDDFLTLLFLSDHPKVDLQAVLITPGTLDQCRLVRWALNKVQKQDVPIGAFNIDHDRDCVASWHYKIYGEEPRTYDPGHIQYGPDLVGKLLGGRWPDADADNFTYLCGSAPKNLGQAHRYFGELRLDRWVQQGFFAGDNIVTPEHRLEKFKGRTTCPSFNPGGDPKSALEFLASSHIRKKVAVSKNVCHSVVWTKEMHDQLWQALNDKVEARTPPPPGWIVPMRPGLTTMLYGLDCYLRDKGQGKAMHDIVAAAVCLDESVVDLTEVDIYRERGEWGSRRKNDTRTWISTAFNLDRFIDVLAT